MSNCYGKFSVGVPEECNGEECRECTTHKPNYHALASNVASLVIEKQVAYGDSFSKSGDVLRILYPDGIPPEKLDDALVIVRVIDKLFRLAVDNDPTGESPWQDIVGYGLLALAKKK